MPPRLIRSWHAPDWPAYVGPDWPRHLLDAPLTDRLHRKQGRSIARWTVAVAGRPRAVFVKRHFRHSWWRSLLARLLPTPASDAGREWHHLRRAESLGVPVPRTLALAEWSGPGGLQSALVLDELAGMLPLHEAIPQAARTLPPGEFRRWKAGLIAELVRLTQRFHDNGYFHRDLYLCHFFIPAAALGTPPPEWPGRVVLIDFHRLTRQRLAPLLGRAKDLAQLLHSARLPGITARDVALFWRLYGRGHRRPLLRRLVAWKADRYRRHNERRARP